MRTRQRCTDLRLRKRSWIVLRRIANWIGVRGRRGMIIRLTKLRKVHGAYH